MFMNRYPNIDAERLEARKKLLEHCVQRDDGVTVCPPAYADGYGYDQSQAEEVL